ncbi:hypothetical protein EG327_002848 [Venturia inaequalis]|uniref:Cytochrome b5 heme-binding domain-containing protein n=1 Tax=Venturia inaequalis TaxID=5025 RepID=A0A8H3VK89_VENIN|nr:hypothetical protein EG327_002848 [Venturia inaequalis]
MSADKEFSFSDVSEHASKKDLFMVVHDKVYNATSFVDEHPGGEEVLLDVGGQDATEAFEDVGHSDEAREILEGLLVGTLKRGVCPLPAVPFLNNCTIVESGPITEELYSYPKNSTFPDSSNQANDPVPKAQVAHTTSSSASAGSAGLGVGLYAFIVIGGAVAFGAYKYLEANKEKI